MAVRYTPLTVAIATRRVTCLVLRQYREADLKVNSKSLFVVKYKLYPSWQVDCETFIAFQ